jgi:hypothetical protein
VVAATAAATAVTTTTTTTAHIPKPSLAYGVVRRLDDGTFQNMSCPPAPWVVPRMIPHPPAKRRPYIYKIRKKAIQPPRNLLFDVSVAPDSCYDDGTYPARRAVVVKVEGEENTIKTHRSTLQRELMYLINNSEDTTTMDTSLLTTSGRSLRLKVPPIPESTPRRRKLKSWKKQVAVVVDPLAPPPPAPKNPRKFTTFYYAKHSRKKPSYIPKANNNNTNNKDKDKTQQPPKPKKHQPRESESFVIPDYEAVAPVLQKLGFQSRNGRFYLPRHGSRVGPEEEDVTFFSSTERLRESLCRHGVPTSTIMLTEEEREDLLLPWVRYAIAVRFLEIPTECPPLMPMLASEAQRLIGQLGARRNGSYNWFLNDIRYDTWREFENFLTHAGIADLVHGSVADSNNNNNNTKAKCPVSKEDVLRLAVYLAQNRRVDLL